MKASRAWLLLFTAPLCFSCRPRQVVLTRGDLAADTTRPPPGVVNVSIDCTVQPKPKASVNPYSVRMGVHDSAVAWVFAGADTFHIIPQPPPPWPFANSEPVGTPGHPAKSGQITSPPAPGDSVIHYRIGTKCPKTDVIIDPEIIIVPH